MKRKIYADLKEWFQRPGRKPLLLRGARQVGKSTAVRLFCELNGIPLLELNLEKNRSLDAVFATLDMGKILMSLQTVLGQPVVTGSVLFLDEIQETPHAIQALRYFYEERPDLAVIGAGSLLEMVLEDHAFSMPVGRIEFLSLGPMLFSEFLMAKGQNALAEIVISQETVGMIDAVTHAKFLEYWRQYLFVGGMPEAVRYWSQIELPHETHEKGIRRIQRSILETYRADFPKYSRGSREMHVGKVFDHVPHALGEKVKYSKIAEEIQSRDLKKAIELLIQAKVILPAYHSTASGLPLAATKNEKVYKLFFLDVGLVTAAQDLSISHFNVDATQRLLTQGCLAEQFVAQHLSSALALKTGRTELYYWLREGRTGNAEVDFITQREGHPLPVEVKSGTQGALRSLHLLCKEKQIKHALRFDLNIASAQHIEDAGYDLQSLPIYAVETDF